MMGLMQDFPLIAPQVLTYAAAAAVIGVFYPRWDERPLMTVVLRSGAEPDKGSILAHLEGKVASWWFPDDVVVVPSLPVGATGKVQKNALREQFKDYALPGV